MASLAAIMCVCGGGGRGEGWGGVGRGDGDDKGSYHSSYKFSFLNHFSAVAYKFYSVGCHIYPCSYWKKKIHYFSD